MKFAALASRSYPKLILFLTISSMAVHQLPADEALIGIEVPLFEGRYGMDFYFEAAREFEKLNPHYSVNLYGDPRIADKIRVRVLFRVWGSGFRKSDEVELATLGSERQKSEIRSQRSDLSAYSLIVLLS